MAKDVAQPLAFPVLSSPVSGRTPPHRRRRSSNSLSTQATGTEAATAPVGSPRTDPSRVCLPLTSRVRSWIPPRPRSPMESGTPPSVVLSVVHGYQKHLASRPPGPPGIHRPSRRKRSDHRAVELHWSTRNTWSIQSTRSSQSTRRTWSTRATRGTSSTWRHRIAWST